ncbi:MAG: rubredoxin [Desulfobacteraceae bacterium 4572_130]|nr:MAG: rubredoxin [Desulfobacteraceae bacterium 4572_130]
MEEYECPCGYVYNPENGDPDNGIDPETAFMDLPEEWLCPLCESDQEYFELLD